MDVCSARLPARLSETPRATRGASRRPHGFRFSSEARGGVPCSRAGPEAARRRRGAWHISSRARRRSGLEAQRRPQSFPPRAGPRQLLPDVPGALRRGEPRDRRRVWALVPPPLHLRVARALPDVPRLFAGDGLRGAHFRGQLAGGPCRCEEGFPARMLSSRAVADFERPRTGRGWGGSHSSVTRQGGPSVSRIQRCPTASGWDAGPGLGWKRAPRLSNCSIPGVRTTCTFAFLDPPLRAGQILQPPTS